MSPSRCLKGLLQFGNIGPVNQDFSAAETVYKRSMRAATYLRVSTNGQTTDNQERELRAAAKRMGHTVVEVYADNGISGAKGRDKRPAFDRLHRDAARRKFDVVMAWSVDRLGRSLQDLVAFLSELHALGIELYLHQRPRHHDACRQGDVPDARRLRWVRARDHPRARGGRHGAGQGQGHQERKPIGRPAIHPARRAAIRATYEAGGVGMRAVAAQFGVGVETVRRCVG
jgi:DNA invertase Pin-like site-specific DNA recombinase